MGERESSLIVGLQTGVVTLEISIENYQKVKSESAIRPRYTTPWCVPKGLNNLL